MKPSCASSSLDNNGVQIEANSFDKVGLRVDARFLVTLAPSVIRQKYENKHDALPSSRNQSSDL